MAICTSARDDALDAQPQHERREFSRTNYSRGKHAVISACAHHWQGGAPQRKNLSCTLCRPPGRNWFEHRAIFGGWAPFHSIEWTPHDDLQQCSIQGRKKPHTCYSDSAGRETRWPSGFCIELACGCVAA